jgi:small nuclear ribonucleoprotein E
LPPINYIFKLLQQRATVLIWLYENLNIRIEGKLRVRYCSPLFDRGADTAQGFDEFMNLVIDDAIEVHQATKDKQETRRNIGQVLLKGDNISLIQQI